MQLRRLIEIVGVGDWLAAAGRFKATPCGGRRGARPTNGSVVLCGRRKPSADGICPLGTLTPPYSILTATEPTLRIVAVP